MAKASEQFRQSDVTIWGVVALVCAGLAVFGSNISLLVPQSIIGGLHQPRVSGASIESLRLQVADLREETVRLKRENELLVTRFSLQERSGNDVIRRVGALEVSVPRLLEQLPDTLLIDRANLTASIGANETLTFDADGGSVSVRQSALPGIGPAPALNQPLPPAIDAAPVQATATAQAYGIAIGSTVAAEQAPALWSDLTLKLGPLLFGLAPLVVDETSGDGKRIVVGPIEQLSEARALCQRFEGVSIPCVPMAYSGTPLNLSE